MKLVWRPALAATTLLAFTALVSLGLWQLQRREWKEALIERVALRMAEAPVAYWAAMARAAAGEDVEYLPVYLEGAFDHAREARVFATRDGVAGVHVFTPLVAADSDGVRRYVYVDRGFAPQAFAAPSFRTDGAPEGDVTVYGLLRRAEDAAGLARVFRPADDPEAGLYFTRDPLRMARAQGIDAAAYRIDSFGRENSGRWPQGGATRVEFSNRHLEYALTWFALAGVLLAVAFAYSLRRD